MRWGRRKGRQQAVAGVVLGVLALLVGCVDAGASGGPGGGRAEAGVDAGADVGAGRSVPARTVAAPPRIPSAPDLPGSPYAVGFAADAGGFALLARCGKKRCRQHVAVLDRGAGSWRLARSPLPDVTGDLGITAGLTVLGSGRALLTEGRWPPPERTWFTDDGGREWRRGSADASGTTPEVPEGAALVHDCSRPDKEGNGCEASRLLVVLPATGRFAVLAGQPPLAGVLTPAGETAGGLLFASGTDPGTGLPALARSEDRGRTWHATALTGSEKPGWGIRVVASGDVLYALQPGQLPAGEGVKNGLLALHRSTDGGHTWERVWKYRKGVDPRSALGDPVADADGGLTVHGEDGVWHSTDGGCTFEPADGTRGLGGSATVTPLGYLSGGSFGAGSYRISTDGVHWHGFELGDGT
ncbi:WD40/YVTN/BNR-like repeat-containing protein [Streptomyces sp. NPDC088747]|uniref:WD40/YVTN/BNR-like repeat-containing protein n=1 Tax=Streptomyces sp. NPDC088747 TaxID=3365886 RepID=UPI003823A3A4